MLLSQVQRSTVAGGVVVVTVVVVTVVAAFHVLVVVVTVVAASHVVVVTVVVASPTIPDVTSLAVVVASPAVVVASPAVVVVVDFEDTDGGRIKRMREWLKLTNVRTWPSHFQIMQE